MTSTMTYEKLYYNMVKKFTIEKNDKEYNLGDYMLMKAQSQKSAMTAKNSEKTRMASVHVNKENALSTFVAFVNDKLTISAAPERTKNNINNAGVHPSIPSIIENASCLKLQNVAPIIIHVKRDDNSMPNHSPKS